MKRPIRNERGFTLGEVLVAMVVLSVGLVAVVVAGVFGVALLASGLRGRKDAVPFGPFLAMGGAMALFWGERVFGWYVSGFGG